MVLPSFFIAVLALAAAPIALVAGRGIQPLAHEIQPLSAPAPVARSHIQAQRMSNAKRLSAGLPLNPPTRRNKAHLDARAAKPSASATSGSTLTGIIQISNSKTGAFVGYLSQDYAIYGEFAVTTAESDALRVSISGVTKGSSGPHEITSLNSDDTTYSNVGAIAGYASTDSSLSSGSPNYVYIGGTGSTPAYSEPANGGSAFYDATGIAEDIESAVWYIKTTDRKITMQWVNPNGATATTTKLAYYEDDNVLIAVGDLKAFATDFGTAIPVALTLVGV